MFAESKEPERTNERFVKMLEPCHATAREIHPITSGWPLMMSVLRTSHVPV